MAAAVFLVFWSASPALAIPSPDLAVNFLASAGQVFGLLAVMIGGLLFGRKGAKAVNGDRSRRSAGAAPRWLIVGIAVIAVSAVVGNILQWANAKDVRNQRLEAALVRPSVENGEQVGDVTLKTLSYSEQVAHPDGMTTEQLQNLLTQVGSDGDKKINLIDLREPEEKEAGHLPQFTPARYPDLNADPKKFGMRKGRTNILLCYSGNRSSETCEVLRARGIPCNFVVGGYEKWLSEGRAVAGMQSGSLTDLRALPTYPNGDLLLDTPEVKRLVDERRAIFVDVRYPGDFKLDHIAGAINMPIRKMTTPELAAAFEALPRQPVIAPCYDKRSCFYAKILGLRLSRAGFTYLGRYTVPHEYFVPKAERSHVADWQAVQSKSLLDFVSEPLANILFRQVDVTGSLPFAIFLVVVALRLVVLPFVAKAERDQVVMRNAAPELAKMRARLTHDRVRLSRAMMAFNRRHQLTPGLNMIGIAIQIPLFLAFFFAVDLVAKTHDAGYLWIDNLSQPDPLLVLPVLLGVLIYLHLETGAAKRSPLFVGMRLAASILLVVLTVALSSAVMLYLVLSIGLMAIQSLYIRSKVERRLHRLDNRKPEATVGGPALYVAPLKEFAGRSDIAGGKAGNLAAVAAAGFPVPDSFVITGDALRMGGDELLTQRDWARVDALWKSLRFDRAAVRSSGFNEDGEDRSYAGVFETVLNVDRDGLSDALRRVRNSFAADSANAYSDQSGEAGAIVVQKMVDAEYAGVMFTEHPGRSGSTLVELTEGLGVGVVDGTADASSFEFGRQSGRPLTEAPPPIDLARLLEIGRILESLFDGPQDVEWAYAKGQFVILQSRAITALAREQVANRRTCLLEGERHRLLSLTAGARTDEAILVQNELSELLPRPTPFSLSLMEEMWQPGGTMDMACRRLGIRYEVGEDDPPFVNSVFGALYVNRREEKRRMRKSGGFVTALRLTRMAPTIESDFWNCFLPALDEDIRVYELVDLMKFSDSELFSMLSHVCKRFVTENYVQAHIINIAANFYFAQAERQLVKRGLPAAEYLSTMPQTIVNRAMSLLSDVKAGRATRQDFIDMFGHRAPVDYEIADPRYMEAPALVDELIASSYDIADANAATKRLPPLPRDKALRLCIERAGKFQLLKEEAKHHCLREFAVIRRVLLALAARLGVEDIFYLTRQEIAELRSEAALNNARDTIAQRREAAEIFESLSALPSELTSFDLEQLALDGEHRALNGHAALMKGDLVAGHAPIRGRARVATGTSLKALEPGEILITRFMHPTWAPALPRVAGVVTEVGGWLSHAAILAREYNVPTIVGVRGAMDRISTGDELQLNPDGSVERI